MWYFGSFFFAGWLLKIVFDKYDKNTSTDFSTEKGRETLGSWVKGLLVCCLFFSIHLITKLTDNADNNVSLAVFLFAYSFFGYFAPHAFLKGAGMFSKKLDEKLG